MLFFLNTCKGFLVTLAPTSRIFQGAVGSLEVRCAGTFFLRRGQHNQAGEVDEFFGGMRNGFFVEAGAWDGVHSSNTLFLELERNWTGLLVEAQRETFQSLLQAKRRSYSVNNCIALSENPEEVGDLQYE